MKNFIGLILLVVVLAACEKTETIDSNDGQLALKKANKSMAIDFHGPHYELNLLGKKDGWNDNEFDNPDRHTIFIPRDTEGWEIELKQPNNLDSASLPGVRIDMSQGDEFAVIDGTVFDGDKAEFQLGSGKYAVFVAMRGKKNVDPAEINAWLEALQLTDYTTWDDDSLWIYQNIGYVQVKRNWTNITDLFTIDKSEAGTLPFDDSLGDEQWIFDYMEWLGQQVIIIPDQDGDGIPEEITYEELAYFWQLQNNGSQLIKVRFFPV